MPTLLDDPVTRLLTRLAPDAPRGILGMAGVPGSGKSTLAARLASEVNAVAGAGSLMTLSMDGFHLPRAALQRMPDPEAAFARRGAPWTFDAALFADRLRQLRAGTATVGWPDFQHEIGDPVEDAFLVPPTTRLILVEGLYLLHRADGWEAVAGLLDETWYLDTPVNVAMKRLADRHMAAWGWTREAAERQIAANDRKNAEIVLATRAHADWLLPD